MNSMTGYGRSKLDINNRQYVVEIKSVNHKYSDIQIKIPRVIGYLEDNVKKEISSNISRGKVDVYITFDNNSDEGKEIVINKDLAKSYIKELRKLARETEIKEDINVIDIMKYPDVLTLKANDQNEDIIWTELKQCTDRCLESFIGMRKTEGEKIKVDLLRRIDDVEKNKEKLIIASKNIVEDYIKKLDERIKELLKTEIVDQSRLAQEVVIYSDKCSIQEELTRLDSHIVQFRQLLNEDKPIGKKVDFLIQEMNRETNTIASKSAKLEMTNIVIEIKTQLEDIREQIQNIE